MASPSPCMLFYVPPVLFQIGSLGIPAYGASAAAGVLMGLALVRRTARCVGVEPVRMWNLALAASVAALVGRVLLSAVFRWLLRGLVGGAIHGHGAVLGWMLTLPQTPLLAAVAVLPAGLAVLLSARWQRLPVRAAADALAAPLGIGLAMEQVGARIAGVGWGVPASLGTWWPVTYTSPQVARWSGTPLGVALVPVQGWAAAGFLLLGGAAWFALESDSRFGGRLDLRAGEVAGGWLMGWGTVVFLTELWRDPADRGPFLAGAADVVQVVAAMAIVAGALLMVRRGSEQAASAKGKLRSQ